MKLLDLFGNVGGVSGVVVFVIAILYTWYNSIRMEQELINKGFLDKLLEESDSIPKHQRKFTFWELFYFNYPGLFCKKSRRGKFHDTCMDAIQERTDLLSFIKTQTKIDTLNKALFK